MVGMTFIGLVQCGIPSKPKESGSRDGGIGSNYFPRVLHFRLPNWPTPFQEVEVYLSKSKRDSFEYFGRVHVQDSAGYESITMGFPRTEFVIKVRVIDENGVAGAWSESLHGQAIETEGIGIP